nr:LacI family DNA-binding transcriptional regulator [uncultured Actinoplanes sp.]
MRHPHPIREIALQAGLSNATVDRVLHRRGGVRATTIADVERAIAELDRRQNRVWPTIRLEVIGPETIRAALEAEFPKSVVRARFHHGDPKAALDRIAHSRAQGLIVQAPATIVERAERLGLPVVALGGDRADAGATAAYLVEQWLADRAGDVLVVGEPDQRSEGFKFGMSEHRRLREVPDAAAVHALLDRNPSVRAVHSLLAGGNRQIVDVFAEAHRNYDVFVAHDLTGENAELLRAGHLSAVLYHDVRAALRRACLALLNGEPPPPAEAVRILTPQDVRNEAGRSSP